MKKEIGSEFWDVPVSKKSLLFPEHTQWFLSGRSALKSIIKDLIEIRHCSTVAIPSWCCDSMIEPFIDAGIKVCFYPVYWENGLIQEVSLECDALLLMDYFGHSGPSPNLSGYSGVVIRDLTHSVFSSVKSDADYYFGSLRKWCGVWTGGYAWTKDEKLLPKGDADDLGYTALREKAMRLKSSYINGYVDDNGNCVTDKSYLNIFEMAEEKLEKVGIAPADERDIALINNIDAEYIKTRRRSNAEILRKAFPKWLIFSELADIDVPMFVPVIVPNGKRDGLRRHLINNEIYCPVHWSVSEIHMLNDKTLEIYRNEISLVCDQRYSEEDMYRIVDTIRQYMEEA